MNESFIAFHQEALPKAFSASVWKQGSTAAHGRFSTTGSGQFNTAHAEYTERRSSMRNYSQPDALFFLTERGLIVSKIYGKI